MDGWNEYWLDIRTPACLTNIKGIQEARMKKFKQKGCDGVDPDNVDSVSCEEDRNISRTSRWRKLMLSFTQ